MVPNLYCDLPSAAEEFLLAAHILKFDFGFSFVCFLTSAVVKISVTLVLFRITTIAANIATVMKLTVVVEWQIVTVDADVNALWFRLVT
ncbi:uncharacterized protein BCR38DRAFT_487808 [Pseudomassariella vexata]|uniref:Uncharacterized protein n=1 Tax=Pseudomassariella vexata TaxID=1141098 RepID=A0A1Y2DNK3_9PEZI|nr:uncharacterized protein BCR38DRAFT_487808 [Pseudomassariella vexata]ORY60744.1 hypothetical protein BCR38DRAFT_487808 [Pseudomassariella vexata]